MREKDRRGGGRRVIQVELRVIEGMRRGGERMERGNK